jgi:CDP-diacylglycerol--glycerol-3-phosphate 3-phosphatidyltransferase
MTNLRRQWLLWLAIYVGGLLLGAGVLAQADYFDRGTPPGEWARWLLPGLVIVGVQLAILGRYLGKNRRRAGTDLLPNLGWGNHITLSRGMAYALLISFVWGPQVEGWLAWIPAILYTAASVADLLDGYVARVTGQTTLLGEVLDMEFDGLGILIVTLLAIHWGQLPWIYLIVAVSRPLFVLGMNVRQWMGLPNYPMHGSLNRRMVAGVHMGFMAVVIWPIFAPPVTHLAGAIFGGALMLSFGRDWLVTIGWIDATDFVYQDRRRIVKRLVFTTLPPLLRLITVGLMGWLVLGAPSLPLWLAGLGLLAGLGTILGIASRVSGVAVIGFGCAHLLWAGEAWANLVVVALGIGLLLVGGGRFCLWRIEDNLFRQPIGQKRGKRSLDDRGSEHPDE